MVFFDSKSVQDDNQYEPIPAGSYPLMVCKVEMKPTKKGDGRYCNVEFKIASGKGAGRKVFDLFNIENPSEQCQQIGKANFKRLVVAAGVPVIQSEDHLAGLVDKIVVGDVVIEKGMDGEGRNKVKRYHPYSSSTSLPSQPQMQPAPKSNNPIDNIPF